MKTIKLASSFVYGLVALLSISRDAEACKEYHVAITGNDALGDGTVGKPFQHIKKGTRLLRMCDILYIHAGSYNDETLEGDWISNRDANSWADAITITAYESDVVTIKPKAGSGKKVIEFSNGNQKYIILSKLVIDASELFDEAIKFNPTTGMQGAHHIRMQDCEIANAAGIGISVQGRSEHSDYNEFIRLKVHDNGDFSRACPLHRVDTCNLRPKGGCCSADGCTKSKCKDDYVELNHGLYISTDYNVVQQCDIFKNYGGGIQFLGGANIARKNKIHDQSLPGNAGIIVDGGQSDTLIYDNVFWNIYTTDISLMSGTGTRLYNNTANAMRVDGISLMLNIDRNPGVKVSNNIFYNVVTSSGVVFKDPAAFLNDCDRNKIECFNNLVGGEVERRPVTCGPGYRLCFGSPAIDSGKTLRDVPDDIFGVKRPKGKAYDVGAYEFVPDSR